MKKLRFNFPGQGHNMWVWARNRMKTSECQDTFEKPMIS